jgi:hypothetical protein
MAQPSDLEARVATLETQVRELVERVRHSEQDAAAARVLAGGAEGDVEQIRGEIRDLSAGHHLQLQRYARRRDRPAHTRQRRLCPG